MRGRIVIIATLAVGYLGLIASNASANPPERSATFEFHYTAADWFAGSGQQCAFPVFGSWDVGLKTVTYFDPAGNPVRVVSRLSFVGTLSNPATGKSIPDASGGPDKITDYYAPDGTFLKEVLNESRDDPYLHSAVHTIVDENGVLVDNGRDWFVLASHVIDIQPLCAALS